MPGSYCDNCGTALSGPYCSSCGQRAHASARSLRALLHDAWHDLTHLEGRFAVTLRRLLLQPGQLTQDYFAGQRARYAPPFRMYLVISVLFFGLSSLADRWTAGGGEGADQRHAAHSTAKPGDCADIHINSTAMEQYAQRLCGRVIADGGESINHTFHSLVPKAMFVFLPLVAIAIGALYRRQHRYFVEHLVFVLHTHAALFAAMAILSILHICAALFAASAIAAVTSTGDLFLLCYATWYVYRALRRYYGLSRGATLLRLAPLGTAYLLCLGLTMAGTFLVSAALV
jgi:uncharacterized membrane protein